MRGSFKNTAFFLKRQNVINDICGDPIDGAICSHLQRRSSRTRTEQQIEFFSPTHTDQVGTSSAVFCWKCNGVKANPDDEIKVFWHKLGPVSLDRVPIATLKWSWPMAISFRDILAIDIGRPHRSIYNIFLSQNNTLIRVLVTRVKKEW